MLLPSLHAAGAIVARAGDQSLTILRPTRRGVHILAAALFTLPALPTFAEERLAVPGTTVSLVPPKGFVPANGFAGLQNPQTKASVLVAELPAEAHPALSQLFASLETAKVNFAKQNVDVASRKDLDTRAGNVPLLVGTQNAGGMSFAKWVALFKGGRTVMITVQSPQDAGLSTDTVETMLKSVSLGAEPSLEEKLGALPFAVASAEPFRIVDTIGGAGVLMTSGPLDADPSGSQPLIIVAAQLSGGRGAKLEALSETLLKQTRGFTAATIAQREKTRFAAVEGYLLAGQDGEGKRFEQRLAIGPDGRFVRLLAISPSAAFDGLKPAIDRVASSIAFKGK